MTEFREIRLSTLGIAAKARKTVAGTDQVCEALKDGKAFVVIEASGNSKNTSKRLEDRCAYYGIPIYRCSAGSPELGAAVGRGPSAAVAITDRSLAAAVTGKKQKAPEKPDPTTV